MVISSFLAPIAQSPNLIGALVITITHKSNPKAPNRLVITLAAIKVPNKHTNCPKGLGQKEKHSQHVLPQTDELDNDVFERCTYSQRL